MSFALCPHSNVFAIAPLQEELKCSLVSMMWTGCFAPATFLVQPHGWTRCRQIFSIFSFYDCGINVQIETSLSMDCWHCLWGFKRWCGPSPFPTGGHWYCDLCSFPGYNPKWHKTCSENSEPWHHAVEQMWLSVRETFGKSHAIKRGLKNSALPTLI